MIPHLFSTMSHRLIFFSIFTFPYADAGRQWKKKTIKFGPACTLLGWRTGQGKSLVRDGVGILLGGITLIMIWLLALVSEQSWKISNKIPDCMKQNLFSYRLYEMESK